MTKFTRIKLKDMTPLHLGLGRDSYDVSASLLQSDTLSAALASIRAMYGKGGTTEQFLSAFTLSSAFPYDGDEYFLPRMKGRLAITVNGKEEKDYRKKLKKLVYISFSLWQRLAQGETIAVDDNQLQGAFLLSKGNDNYKAPMTHITTERVSVARNGEDDAVPFMYNWTFFRHGSKTTSPRGEILETKESGLYCLLRADAATTQEITDLFHELGDQGIGSDKSVGGGHFTIETDTVELADVESDKQILLSTYIPTKEEVKSFSLDESTYQLIHRGGFMAGSNNEHLRHLRRKTVYMFDTESVIVSGAKLEGKIVNVAPQWNAQDIHPVYRSGRCLAMHIL